ncbi:3alpha(or 20beta)-hydroxysteroid dehydrogenase [Methylobacterium brachiatum]|uniref:3alpha(Or 20beta)-hydroxysteroid dehydrogenase n=1 Tax=Methylobacterium brachiatum TaxID=269660 RepID=A0AAJ1U0N2_9HYPH|nr:SDR family oxidoreductase [Methylobacterium brachiatum]MCB4805904.1 SDR family oxidoreductase [Methylobacterium brachiatum]MDQ0547178.1 3alpha(or 20beta)-hydroxysteroid dehydrogenase [Methylobacterium brachiatum]
MNDMQGEVIIVTGGTRGQGEAEVRLLVEAGAKVVFGGRDEADGQRIAGELGGDARFLRQDVGVEADWVAIVTHAEETFGKVTGLVNNAGVTITGLVTDLDAETVMEGIRINQLGQLLGMKHVVPALRRNGGGTIVNIGSEAGVRAAPYAIAYSGTKAAIGGMTRTAAIELAGDGIRVNLVTPGPIDTPMIENAAGAGAAKKMGAIVPLGRVGQPLDVAHAVVFLLSKEAGFITGAELAVDGGRTAAPASAFN